MSAAAIADNNGDTETIEFTLILAGRLADGDLVPTRRNPLAALLVAVSVGFDPSSVRLEGVRDAALSWHIPPAAPQLRGARLLSDAVPPAGPALAAVRSIVRANHRIAPLDALDLAQSALGVAHQRGIDGNFFIATMLQESAFEPRAISGAGALGLAQFTFGTADLYGVDPWDPYDALAGAGRVLGGYVRRYASEGDPYALAAAAYNAGPGTVAAYHGIPPYRETREYVTDIWWRWGRLVREGGRVRR